MTADELRERVRRALSRVAPETAGTELRPDGPLRQQLDLDSMDFLNFVIALHKDLRVEIPEADYPRLSTLDGAVEYLKSVIRA
jgi:acyl carrier protein